MPMIAGYGGGWWIYGVKSGVKRIPGDYMAALNAFFAPKWGDVYISQPSEIRYGSAPNNRIRIAQTGETKCALKGSVSMDKNNKRV
jgi:hypothetical protein